MRRLAFVLVGCALVAASCSSASDDEIDGVTTSTTEATTTTLAAVPTTESEQAVSVEAVGGDATIVNGNPGRAFAQSINPYKPGGFWSPSDFINTMLWDWRAGGDLIPIVVESVPTVENGLITLGSDGTMTVRYEVREEAVWSDGMPITGDDFQFTLDMVLEHGPELELSSEDYLLYREILSTRIGPKWFEATFPVPTLTFDPLFQPLIPKHDVEGSNFLEDWNVEPWVSGSAFILEEWAGPGTGEFKVTRNPRFWLNDLQTGERLPFLDSITGAAYDCDDLSALGARLDDLETGSVHDVALCGPEAADGYVPPDGVGLRVTVGGTWSSLAFQFGVGREKRNPGAVTDDIRVRRAIAHAIDKAQLVIDVYGEGAEDLVIDSYVTAYSPSLARNPWAEYDYDIDRSRSLLAEFCDEEGSRCADPAPTVVFTTSSDFPYRMALAASLERMLTQVGFDVVLDLEDSVTFFGESAPEGTYDVAEWAWAAAPTLVDLVSVHQIWDPGLPGPDGPNYYQWGTEAATLGSIRYAELVEAITGEVELEKLAELISEAEQILADELVFIPLFIRPNGSAHADCFIDGAQSNSTVTEPFMLWYLTEDCR